MTWTTPKTWAVGEIVTAANLNLHLRDNLNHLMFRCTTTTRPTTNLQVGQRIYETDTYRVMEYQGATTGWTLPWSQPWGRLTAPLALIGADVTLTTTDTSLITLPSVSVPAGRQLRISAAINMSIPNGGGVAIFAILRGVTTVGRIQEIANTGSSTDIDGRSSFVTDSPAAGSYVYKMNASSTLNSPASSVRGATSVPGGTVLTLEDIGPSANPS